jgi:exodeoxyribonuclease V gamma subunit
MVRLHYSNRLENLVAPLAAAIGGEQRARPLDRIAIVVSNRAVEQFVRYRLAEANGIAANLDFPFLRRHLADLARSAASDLEIVEAEHLQVILFECLRDAQIFDAPEMEPVRAHLAASAGAGPDRERRMFAFAGQLARLFHEYSISRGALLRRWRSGTQFSAGAAAESERWQRMLWRAIFADDGTVRGRWIAEPARARWMLLPDAYDALDGASLARGLPPSLHFFGLSYAGPAYIRIFDQLARRTAVAIYALNPCCEFWEDLKDATGAERAELVHRGYKSGANLDESDDPFALAAPGDTPALRLWGRPGREYIRMLNEAAECDFDAHFSDASPAPARTLLANLQRDLLVRAPERPAVAAGCRMPDDGSIRMLECPGVRREIEIVANEIWSLLGAGDAERARTAPRFHEIGVLVPDAAAGDYLPHIETVFAEQHRIPVDMVTRGLGSESRIGDAVALLLALPRGRFGRSELLHLLTHPGLLGTDPDADPGRWTAWTRTLGVFFGADAEELDSTYLPRDLAHWDQALCRLALGVFMERDQGDSIRTFRSSAEAAALLPHHLGEQDIAGAARLVHAARSLIADALELRAHRMPLVEWSRALIAYIDAHIRPGSAADQRARDRCVAAIEAIAPEGLRNEPIGCETALALAADRIADTGAQPGRLLGRGVAVGRLSDLRALPFKVIFMLGLGESIFPERDRRDPIDLRVATRRAGDVAATERDRYFFLETLLAARERIRLSWVARDPRTGDPLEPSSTVRELQFILRGYLDEPTLEALTARHRLSRYDLSYFPDLRVAGAVASGNLVSFDPRGRHGAQAAALRSALERQHPDLALPGRDRMLELMPAETRARFAENLKLIDLSAEPRRPAARDAALRLPVTALRRFLECPLQGAARYALGMTEDDDEDADAGNDEEPLAETVLDRSILLRDVFWSARGDPAATRLEYAARFAIGQAEGRAPAGPFADGERDADRRFLANWIAAALKCGDLKRWRDVRIGHAEEFERADQVLEPIVLEVEVPDASGGRVRRRVSLHGSAGYVARGVGGAFEASLLPVLRSDLRPKDFLRPVFSTILLAAVGEHVSAGFDAVVVAGDGSAQHRRLAPWTRDRARDYLAVLVTDLLSGSNHYFLPIEAVARVRSMSDDDPYELADGLRDYKTCSSYGPVRGAPQRFAPPDAARIRAIIVRRFDPIAQIFEKEKRRRG